MMGVLATSYAPQVIDCLFDMAFDTSSSHPTASTSSIRAYPTNTTPPTPHSGTHASHAWETQYERAQILNRDAITVILEVLPIAASQVFFLK